MPHRAMPRSDVAHALRASQRAARWWDAERSISLVGLYGPIPSRLSLKLSRTAPVPLYDRKGAGCTTSETHRVAASERPARAHTGWRDLGLASWRSSAAVVSFRELKSTEVRPITEVGGQPRSRDGWGSRGCSPKEQAAPGRRRLITPTGPLVVPGRARRTCTIGGASSTSRSSASVRAVRRRPVGRGPARCSWNRRRSS